MEKIYLEKLYGNDEKKILDMIFSDDDLRKTFMGDKNTQSRLINSVYSALIKKEDIDVGFVMLVENMRTNKYEIDMGILKEYRSKGYGTEALKILKGIILNNKLDVEIQIKKVNIGAIKSVLNNGFTLCREDVTCNYYGLNKK